MEANGEGMQSRTVEIDPAGIVSITLNRKSVKAIAQQRISSIQGVLPNLMRIASFRTGFDQRFLGELGNQRKFGASGFPPKGVYPGSMAAVAVQKKRLVNHHGWGKILQADDHGVIFFLDQPVRELAIKILVAERVPGKDQNTAGIFIQAVNNEDSSKLSLQH